MTRYVLVPLHAAPLFGDLEPGRFTPVGYTYDTPSRLRALARRLGIAPPPRLVLPQTAELAAVDALWLGGDVELSAAETDALLARLPSLAWVYSQRTGIEHLHAASYRRRGIAVSNAGALTARWVAEMHVACLAGHAKQLPTLRRLQDRHQSRPRWVQEFDRMHAVVVGTGAIGGETARLLRGLGMRVTGASRTPARFAGVPHDYDAVVGLTDALTTAVRDADALVLALPQAADTVGLVTRDVLARMPAAAVLVNLARPRLVDERALVRALRAGRPGAAYVSRLETLTFGERIAARRLPNLFLTHVSEAQVASKLARAFAQFVDLADQQRAGAVGLRVI